MKSKPMKIIFSRILIVSIFLLSSAFFQSCSDENSSLKIPESYKATFFETNASIELAVLNQLAALTTEMQSGRSISNTVDKATLTNLYEEGSVTISSLSTDYYDSKIMGENGFFSELSNASGNEFIPQNSATNGGVYGAYLFNQYGLEPEQQIEKGLFAAALYHHFCTLSKTDLTAKTVDQLLALTGANPTFPSSTNASLHERPDRLIAAYIARRDKNDGNGFYSTLKNEFIRLQAAIEQGKDFDTDKMEAIDGIKKVWEKATLATVINYANATLSTLSSTNPTDAQKASALHAYSEAVGFLHGFKTINQTDKIITDSQIDTLLALLQVPANGNPTSYLLITDSVNQLPKLQEVITVIQSIYGFTNQDLEDFKKNWVSEQSR
jgi:hypothetical protein